MNQPVRTETPSGEKIVILSAAEYDRLSQIERDVEEMRATDRALADYRSGKDEGLTSDEMRELLAAPTPLHFWRRKRGLSQARLADITGYSQPYLNQIENGKRAGKMVIFRKLASALDLTIGQLDDGTTTG